MLRRLARRLGIRRPHPVRRATARWRALPDFVIVGVQKAATSSTYRYLCAQPGVEPALRKELHFFDQARRVDRLHRYRASFPMRWSLRVRGRITGEATPKYLVDERARSALCAALPEARLVVVLREPIARIWSQYRMMVRLGMETRTFGDAVDLPEAKFQYVARSLYAEQLEGLLNDGPKLPVLVLFDEGLFDRSMSSLRMLHDHLGLEWPGVGDFPHELRGGGTEEVEPGDVEVMQRLGRQFEEPNRRLVELMRTRRDALLSPPEGEWPEWLLGRSASGT